MSISLRYHETITPKSPIDVELADILSRRRTAGDLDGRVRNSAREGAGAGQSVSGQRLDTETFATTSGN